MKKILLIFIALLTLFSKSDAQNISNKGTEFWTSFPHNGSFEVYTGWLDTPKLSFVFSAEMDAKVNIFINGTSYKQEISVPAGTVVRSANMPLGERSMPGSPYNTMLVSRLSTFPGGTNSEGVFKNKAIHITSDVPVTCAQQLVQPAASYAAMLCPVDSWGYSYKVLTLDHTINARVPQPGSPDNQSTNNLTGYPRFAFVNILAHYDNTKVRFTPTHETRSGLPANVPIEIVLNKGEVYQSLANITLATYKNSNDFINSTVVSIANSDGVCLPFMVSVGTSDNYTKCDTDPFRDVNTGSSFYAEDPAFQQLFPVEAWGRRYVTIPSSNYNNPSVLNQNLFRVMPKDPGSTIVKRNGVPLTGLTKGYYEFRSNTADYIEADNPIQVLQIFPSQGACGYDGVGDPEMFFLSPIEQGVKKTAFLRTNKASIDYNYMSLCIPTIGIASLKIDGKLNNYTSAFPHPNLPGYSIVLRNWHTRSNTDVRPETMCTVECDTTFIGSSYGFGNAESYSLNVGTYINNLSGYPKIKNSYNDSDTTNFYACVNSPVDLYVSLRYEPTKIIAQFTKSNADIINPKDIVINNPKYVSIDEIYGVPYYRYKIMDSVMFSTPGIKDLLVFASNPKVEQCDNTEKIPYKIEIKDAI
ncbi:IgGFc-binding protein, partial [Polluticaenibacter yanchengensis]|nr:IgGFc-binding protein [Chitinophagaceae bacterium LY-5]